MTRTATFIRDLPARDIPGLDQSLKLYHLDPPLPHPYFADITAEHVVVSAMLTLIGQEPEVMVFAANSDGVVLASEMPGTDRGHRDHVRALNEAGYEVAA